MSDQRTMWQLLHLGQSHRPFSVTLGARCALATALVVLGCGSDGGAASVPPFQAPPAGSSGAPPAVVQTPEPAPPDPTPVPGGGEELPPVAGLEPPQPLPTSGNAGQGPTEQIPPEEEAPPTEDPLAIEPLPEEPPVECAPLPNPGTLDDGDINVNLATEFQTISGFGGINVPGWIADLTPEQVDTAFGRGEGQLGLSILRVRIAFDEEQFEREVPTARLARALGAKVFATPWTPPPSLKTNNAEVAGELARENYGAYADHLLAFRELMATNGVLLEAISVQNEPDIEVDYESCDWSAAQLRDFLIEQGPRFGDTRLIAAESFNFNRQLTDPLLNDAAAAAEFEIVGGHIYGAGLADYPLARQRGKEVWMTEHYTDSNNSANLWPNALNVGTELDASMQANFNAYVWWFIRRSYGFITEDGLVSKRGYIMSQYARFVRPGFVRVAASQPAGNAVRVTAYKHGAGRVVLVAVNTSGTPQTVNLDVFGSCVQGFERFTTSQTKNAAADGALELANGRATLTFDPQSVTTLVSR